MEWAIEHENGIAYEFSGFGGVSGLPDPMESETPFEGSGLADYQDVGLISRRDTFYSSVNRSVWGYNWTAQIPSSVADAQITWFNTSAEASMDLFSPPDAIMYYNLTPINGGFGYSAYRSDLGGGITVPWSYTHGGTTTLNVNAIVQAAISDGAYVANQEVMFLIFPNLGYTHDFTVVVPPLVTPPQVNGFLVNPGNPGQWTTFELKT